LAFAWVSLQQLEQQSDLVQQSPACCLVQQFSDLLQQDSQFALGLQNENRTLTGIGWPTAPPSKMGVTKVVTSLVLVRHIFCQKAGSRIGPAKLNWEALSGQQDASHDDCFAEVLSQSEHFFCSCAQAVPTAAAKRSA
jgi:hypothetical protein